MLEPQNYPIIVVFVARSVGHQSLYSVLICLLLVRPQFLLMLLRFVHGILDEDLKYCSLSRKKCKVS